MNALETALRYHSVGLCVLPADAVEKRPALASWKPYQQRLPTEAGIRAWFASDRPICILTGAVSGNLEMIDFDGAGEKFSWWRELVETRSPGLTKRLLVERSPSGGWHVVYRCESEICGNIKLAEQAVAVADDQKVEFYGKRYKPRRVNDRWEVVLTLIETRGEGGLFLCAPSPGYELAQGDYGQLPILSDKERELLLEVAWSLNELQRAPEPEPVAATGDAADDRPGDDYNQRGDIRELLRRHGWTLVRPGENEYWCRPGKSAGVSATLKGGIFYVFSSNAAPFEPDRAYRPFSVCALLEHGGDFSAAATALRAQGYGAPLEDTASSLSLPAIMPLAEQLPEPLSIRQLTKRYPELRPPVIEGLLREGETMNVIAAPKAGKSWLASDLAIAVTTGRPWLGTFCTWPGDVLIVDNELHAETSANRIPRVAEARGVPAVEFADRLQVVNLRGRLRDLNSMAAYFTALERNRFRLIVLDAFYRFVPPNTDENDNGAMANLYNRIDWFADRLRCAFVLIHHASKGSQAGKAVTDVGAGAGSQSRATDTHLVLRPHELDDCVVLDAAVRSWPPVQPRCLRWSFPIWNPDDTLDPAALRRERPRRKAKVDDSPPEPEWDARRFAATFVRPKPATMTGIVLAASGAGLSERKATKLLKQAEVNGDVYRWRFGANRPVQFATTPQAEGGV